MSISEMMNLIPAYAWLHIAAVPTLVFSYIFFIVKKTGFPTEFTVLKILFILLFFTAILVGIFYSTIASGIILFVACLLAAIENIMFSLKHTKVD